MTHTPYPLEHLWSKELKKEADLTVTIHTSRKFQKLIWAIAIATWVAAWGAALKHGYDNASTWGGSTEQANTPLTDLRGVQKIDKYDSPAYAWDPSDGLYDWYDIIRDGIESDGFIDNLVWLPWNFSIFLWWLMIAGIGVSLTREKKQSLELKIREALGNGEKVSFSDWKDTISFQLSNPPLLTITKGSISHSGIYLNYDEPIRRIINAYKNGTIMNQL